MSVDAPPRIGFVCPRCLRPLSTAADCYRCDRCSTDYPIVAGIPDLRVAPDPWIGLEQDREKALLLDEVTAGSSFEDTVRAYWDLTPETPRRLADRFIDHVLGADARSREWLNAVNAEEEEGPPGMWLELGCGTGDLVAAAEAQGQPVVGIDIALRWLVVARKRPGLEAAADRLVCCCAEHLPFPNANFARVLSLGMLEHCGEADAVLAEGRRVLRQRGVMRVRTVNRFTLLAEPHVGVWGVGFLPRRWTGTYVRWRTGQPYLNHRPRSRREIRGIFRRGGFTRTAVVAARLLAVERKRLGPVAQRLAPLYGLLRHVPMARTALSWVAHLLEARGEAG